MEGMSVNKRRPSKLRSWRWLVLILLAIGCFLNDLLKPSSLWSNENLSGVAPKVAGENDETLDFVESLVQSKRAIQITIRNEDPPMNFPMLLFPATVDKLITPKLQQTPVTYEREVSLFLQHILQNQHGWAVDLGANVGYHSLFMASLSKDLQVIAMEAAPDTAQLLRGSLALNGWQDRVRLVVKGASDLHSLVDGDTLARHADSPGMTTLVATQTLPWTFHNVDAPPAAASSSSENTGTTREIELVPVEALFQAHGLPQHGDATVDELLLIKVDVEGFEPKAFRGANLDRYPFRYILFEFFPQLIRASGEDPIDLLEFVVLAKGYFCIQGWSPNHDFDHSNGGIGESRDQLAQWAKTIKSHTNVFCQRTTALGHAPEM